MISCGISGLLGISCSSMAQQFLDWLWAMSQIVSDIKVPDFFVCLERRVRLLLYSLMQIYILLHLIFSSLLIYFSCVFRMQYILKTYKEKQFSKIFQEKQHLLLSVIFLFFRGNYFHLFKLISFIQLPLHLSVTYFYSYFLTCRLFLDLKLCFDTAL